jgi:hypothetical protein
MLPTTRRTALPPSGQKSLESGRGEAERVGLAFDSALRAAGAAACYQ